jgi:hypothetical protein
VPCGCGRPPCEVLIAREYGSRRCDRESAGRSHSSRDIFEQDSLLHVFDGERTSFHLPPIRGRRLCVGLQRPSSHRIRHLCAKSVATKSTTSTRWRSCISELGGPRCRDELPNITRSDRVGPKIILSGPALYQRRCDVVRLLFLRTLPAILTGGTRQFCSRGQHAQAPRGPGMIAFARKGIAANVIAYCLMRFCAGVLTTASASSVAVFWLVSGSLGPNLGPTFIPGPQSQPSPHLDVPFRVTTADVFASDIEELLSIAVHSRLLPALTRAHKFVGS